MSIYLRFSDGISTEEPVEICVRRASTPGYFQECVPTRRTLQQDLDDRLSVVELRPLAANGLEPETPYVVDILSVTSVHAQRITFEPDAFGWTTGMAPDPTDASDVGDESTHRTQRSLATAMATAFRMSSMSTPGTRLRPTSQDRLR